MPCGGCSTLYGVNPYYRSSRPDVFCMKGVLGNSQNLQENTCARDSFLIKLQVLACTFNLKRVSGTGVFLWILQNFQEHLCQRPFFNYLKKLYLKRVSGTRTFL